MRSEKGFSLIETLVALAILGATAVVFLSGIATTSRAAITGSEQSIAESLVRSQIEYTKSYPYLSGTDEYPVDPDMEVPENWQVPAPAVEPVHGSEDGLQEVTVSAEHSGREILAVAIYKVNR